MCLRSFGIHPISRKGRIFAVNYEMKFTYILFVVPVYLYLHVPVWSRMLNLSEF